MVKQRNDRASPIKVSFFPEQHYHTVFSPSTGFFARIEDPGHSEPFWSWHGPELIDISITNSCDRGCLNCYRNSEAVGQEMSVVAYERVMQQATRMRVSQVALGGGNPNQHPDFCRLLELTRRKYDIIPTYTTNGRGLTTEVLAASRQFCGAVAVSVYEPYREMLDALKLLLGKGIKTNLHFVLDGNSIQTAIEWLREPPAFLDGINALVFLNYKPAGRVLSQRILLKHSPDLPEFFNLATHIRHPFKVGFDSCLISGLALFSRAHSAFFDGCEAGRYSMFVSETLEMYPCSFMSALGSGIPLEEENMQEVWLKAKPFVEMRNALASTKCPECTRSNVCLGGCPIFPEINLCA